MRKQYHFRKVENDTYIWDVDHLVELTQSFQVRQVPLSDIKELDEAYWYPDTHPTTQDIIAHMQLIQGRFSLSHHFMCSRSLNGWYAQRGKSKDFRQRVHFCGSI